MYYKNTNINTAFKVPLRLGNTTNSDIFINLMFDYTQQKYEIRYVGALDIISRIGGYMASFLPIMNISAPLFLLYFLYKLSQVLRYQAVL